MELNNRFTNVIIIIIIIKINIIYSINSLNMVGKQEINLDCGHRAYL